MKHTPARRAGSDRTILPREEPDHDAQLALEVVAPPLVRQLLCGYTYVCMHVSVRGGGRDRNVMLVCVHLFSYTHRQSYTYMVGPPVRVRLLDVGLVAHAVQVFGQGGKEEGQQLLLHV